MELEEVNSTNFEDCVTKNKNVVLVDFYATWCGPCRMLNPVLEKVGDELTSEKVNIYKLNIDDCLEIAKQYNVLSVPTMLLFKDGKEIERLVGLRQKSQIKETIININK